jgi:flagellar hook assembly protein FlgD
MSPAISPGVQDLLSVEIEVDPGENLSFERYEFTVQNAQGETVFMIEEDGDDLPRSFLIEWDGMVDGEALPDAQYIFFAEAWNDRGRIGQSRERTVVIDNTVPDVSVSRPRTIFSPNGDGQLEQMPISQEVPQADSGAGAILNANDEVVRTFDFTDSIPETVEWDGETDGGDIAPDGSYTYRLTAVDRAGNEGSESTRSFELDTQVVTEANLAFSDRYASPNDDGVQDRFIFIPSVPSADDLVSYQFRITDSSGAVVYQAEGEGSLEANFIWEGIDQDTGEPVPNGEYTARLRVTYSDGSVPTATVDPVVVDREAPQVSISASTTIFSPDGDGNKDQVTISQETSEEQQWTAEIENQSGQVVLSETWEGNADDFVWQGQNEDGEVVPRGSYEYSLSATDRAGNSSSESVRVTVDPRPTPVSVELGSSGFSPNGDGRQDTITIDPMPEIEEGIQEWQVVLSAQNADAERVFSGGTDTSFPDTIVWDGTIDGNRAPEGAYSVEVSLVYRKGNRPTATTEQPIILDVTAPSAGVSATPERFAPDGDDDQETLELNLDVGDNREISLWRISIIEPGDGPFYQMSGEQVPDGPVTWDGENEEGELVESATNYRVRLSARDPYGNQTQTETSFRTGILVMVEEDGDRRIRVPGIHFEEYRDQWNSLSEERISENEDALAEIADILNTFPEAEITIQGHAVREFFDDPELREEEQEETLIPLSTARAEVVRDYLIENHDIDPDRFAEVEGIGGAEPLVPHGDMERNWRNRRVEFLLTDRGAN